MRYGSIDPHDFNPLRPCGRRRFVPVVFTRAKRFQSTPPVWAETAGGGDCHMGLLISIHSARVGGDLLPQLLRSLFPLISIHSARVGGDSAAFWVFDSSHEISIHSARVGGDDAGRSYYSTQGISIHSARVGGDVISLSFVLFSLHFNPLRPCGRRRYGWF